jgi:PAS domain S-box-containing protein
VWAIVLVATLILVSVLVVVQQTISHEREQAFANARDLNSKVVLSDEVRIRSLLASLDKVLLVLRRDFAENPRLTHRALILRLDELKIDNELNPRVSFVAASGDVLLSSARSSNGQKLQLNVADRAYFQKQKTQQDDVLLVGAPIESRVSGQWIVPLTRRITNKDGSFGGVITMTVDPSLFTEPFAETSFGTNATRAIMGLDGYTLLRLNGGKVIFGGDTRKSRLYEEIKKSKVGSYTAIASSDGIKRMVSYRVIDPYGLIILAGSAVDSIEASYSGKVRAYVMASTLFGLLVVLLSGLLILSVVRQRKLFKSQQSFNQLIELVPQLVCSLDAKGKVTWVNGRTVEYIGPSAEQQAQGFDWVLDAIHPEDMDRVQEFVAAVLVQDQGTQACEYRRRRFDGAYLWFSSQITRVLDKEGVDVSFLQTGTDIHDRKMAEERTRVTQKLESIGQLTGGMAHDFNNLLAIIIGNQELLQQEALSEQGAKRLQVATSAAQRGVGLVKSLLALASKQPLLPATVDLWALVERIAPLLRHALGQRVQCEMTPPAIPVHVHVDEAGLEAVLLNLIVNARDAMPRGGSLSLSLVASAGMARLLIADSGTGMPPAVLKRATEPFFTTKERGHGTGLGLSMVAGFVKQSGGTMSIQSEEGKGTTIEISLPLVLDTPVAVAPVAAPILRPATSDKRKILIVDDEPALAELVQAWARAQGHIAVLASSADDALVLLAVRRFDILLTDIMMPGRMDGIGLAEAASALYPELTILLMSGYSRETATNRADVPWDLLVKPFRQEDFDAALEKAFRVSGFASLA